MPATLANVNLFVRSVPRSVDFYERVFGLAVSDRMPADEGARLPAGAVTLMLQSAAALGESLAAVGGVELGFEVDDVDAARARLLAWGLPAGEVERLSYGRSFNAHDPDGHRLVVYHLAFG
jgi:catechol 2,3-dioxygenase-like lactoylglutathione lyase family enzyme